MNCPVCGAKLKDDKCKYCENVTLKRIKNASNKLAKQEIKSGNKQNVVHSTYVPSDVNKTKLFLFTYLLGWLGIHHFYVGNYIRGIWASASAGLAFIAALFGELNSYYSWNITYLTYTFTNFFALIFAIYLILWFGDLVLLPLKKFKVPVVFPQDDK